jgi:hypothetical protein
MLTFTRAHFSQRIIVLANMNGARVLHSQPDST